MKFIVCYDDTNLAGEVVKEAQKHARVWNASLEIVKAIQREEPIKYARILEMETSLQTEVGGLLEDADIPYSVQLNIDDVPVGEKILHIAQQKGADLIFIGIKKHSKVGKLIFGSTAQHIILQAPCPVVTVNRVHG